MIDLVNVKKIKLESIKERQDDQVIYNAVAILNDDEEITCFVFDEGFAYRVTDEEITIESLYDTEIYQVLQDVPEWVEVE